MIDLGIDYNDEPDWKVRILPVGDGRWEYELATDHTFQVSNRVTHGTRDWVVSTVNEWGTLLCIPYEDLQGFAKEAIKARRKAENIILRVKRHWKNLQRSAMTVDAGLVTHWDGDPSQ